MQKGRSGMGPSKHRTSGYPTRSPRYKFMQSLEANKIKHFSRPALTAKNVAEAIKQIKSKG